MPENCNIPEKLVHIIFTFLMLLSFESHSQIFIETGENTGVEHAVQLNVLMGGGVTLLDYNNWF